MARKAPDKVTAQSVSPAANHVTLFSNGIGHFRRVYKIAAGNKERISIPFKRDHVSDVLASLSVFGNVKYDSPPSFTPTNSNATSLSIDPTNSMLGLLRDARGAQVTVNMLPGRGDKRSASLAGTESHDVVDANGSTRTVDYVCLLSGGSITKVALSEVASVHFDDESVRSEIEKALTNAFQKIKPDSTFLDLSLSGLSDNEESAVVQYAVPVAAWKMRYSIRRDGDAFTLEGTAIIDNNTDEDWNDFLISVVTGNPISFSTDLAQIRVPARAHINLVDTVAHGAVGAEEGYESVSYSGGLERAACAAPAGGGMRSAKGMVARARGAYTSQSNCAQFGMMEAADDVVEDFGPAAVAPGVEAKEIGDFCVFTSKEKISIQSKRSAVVPMFTVPLTKAGSVLLFKESDHARRPWRAVKFKNETDFSLGKGKVVIYQDGVFSGECVMEAAKPGDNRMLPHCLENGVKVVKESKGTETKQTSLRFSQGFGYTETVYKSRTSYKVENKKDEEFKLLIEHTNVLGCNGTLTHEFDGVKIEESEKISNGIRLYFVLPAGESLTLTVTETMVAEQSFGLGNQFNWLQQNVINVKHPLALDKGILAAAEIQKQIDAVGVQVRDMTARKNELVQQAERVRSNLQATKDEAASQIRTQWVTDLDESEKEIRLIDKKLIPELQAKQRDLQEQLGEALKQLSAAWKA